MLKHITLATLGLTAAMSVAKADTDWPAPGLSADGLHIELGFAGTHGLNRLADVCDALGIDCPAPLTHDLATDVFSPEALADAEKRLALRLEEREEAMEHWEELAELVPTLPHLPYGLSHSLPRDWPHTLPYGWPRAPLALEDFRLPEHRDLTPAPHQLFGWNHPLNDRFLTVPRPRLPQNVIPHGYSPLGLRPHGAIGLDPNAIRNHFGMRNLSGLW